MKLNTGKNGRNDVTWKKDSVNKFNEEHAIEDKRASSLIAIANDEVDQAAYNIRIPYEDLDYLQCTTVDTLLLLASGVRPMDVKDIISERYGIEYTINSVYSAKKQHPVEFHKMLSFYREIFLNQQVQGLEQRMYQKLDMAIGNIQIRTASDYSKIMSAMKSVSDIRKNKEEEAGHSGISTEAMKKLESKMKAITGK